MATSAMSGTIANLVVSQHSARIDFNSTNGREKLMLWSDEVPGFQDRVTQSMWVSLCREAIVSDISVLVTFDSENSAQVISIQIPG